MTASEVDSFVKSAKATSIEVQSFCWMLAFSGCRISEALSLTRDSIDFEAKHVIIRCLKKRGKRVFRAIPLPPDYLKLLRRWLGQARQGTALLWPWSRMTGYRRICEVMQAAGVRGGYATPKGLRHAFGVRAIQASVPLTLVQRWLGHADIKTTAIYTGAMGPEEREIAARMWQNKSMWAKPSPDDRSAIRDRETNTVNSSLDYPELDEYTRDTSSRSEDAPVSFDPAKVRSAPTPFVKLVNGAKKITETRAVRMLYCPLIQFWIDRHRLTGSTRRVSGGLNGPCGAQSGGERRDCRQRAYVAPSQAVIR
ncbi:tyrosine-type recombinase/integrase [Sphingobium indicum]|uniref:tyrosine-type recombinase/integrase n=1 Tax=Sphingobium indicum TaxID=332055 RepID=UPI0018C8DD55|nr:site-specific integrase [Sphingobium indicum]